MSEMSSLLSPSGVGQAIDVHAFAGPQSDYGEKTLWLACLEWPGEVLLKGIRMAMLPHMPPVMRFGCRGLGDLGNFELIARMGVGVGEGIS